MNKRSILVVDDNVDLASLMSEGLSDAGYQVFCANAVADAQEICAREHPHVVISDLVFPTGDGGMGFLAWLKESHPSVDFIMVTGQASLESAVQALRHGAYDYIRKPFDEEELHSTIERLFAYRQLCAENERLRTALVTKGKGTKIVIGSSMKMRRMMDIVQAVAPMPTSVLIRGDSGVGKELVADEVHRLSMRAHMPMIKVNCAALPETLLESELFGHEKGAFTGASQKRIGRFEEADGGTIFLDEIGEMSPLVQAKLLRVLQQRTFQRVGANQTIKVDVRIICATNADLETAVATGRFREDLYYRINVVDIHVPPLCERRETIPLIAEELARRISLRLGVTTKRFSRDSLALLQQMDFPGNVRELQNLVERGLIFSKGDVIEPDAFCPGFKKVVNEAAPSIIDEIPLLGMTSLDQVEKSAIEATLVAKDWNMLQAAKVLDISRSTLYSKVRKHGLEKAAAV